MKCQKCDNIIPAAIWVDGKKRNLQRRKFCLECSPFGLHNTKKLHEAKTDTVKSIDGIKICSVCQKPQNIKQRNGTVCWSCLCKRARNKRMIKLVNLLGGGCWVCGYDDCIQALDFHHMNPEQKSFQLSSREMQYSWDRIWNEAQKCCLLCCRCHREFHAGLPVEIDTIYNKRWEEILGTVAQ